MPKLFSRFKSFHLSYKEAADICHGLHLLLTAGIPLMHAFSVLSSFNRGKTRQMLNSIEEKLHSGMPLWKSLNESKMFLPMVISIVRLGEQTGDLDHAFEKCHEIYAAKEKFRQSMISALSYPAFVLATCCFMIIFMVAIIFPMFSTLFSGFDMPLPLLTVCVINVFSFIYTWGLLSAIIIFFIGLGLAYLFRNRLEEDIFNIKLRVPLIKNMMIEKIAGDIGSLLEAGIGLASALEEIQKEEKQMINERILKPAQAAIMEGQSLSEALLKCKLFDRSILGLVRLGEESASLGKMLLEISRITRLEIESRIKRLVGLIEPMATLTVGAVVSIMALAMIMPIFNLIDVLQK